MYAVHSSNAELARRAGVSEPTVTRFSRSVGCRGVRELKVRLAQATAVGRIYLELPPHVGHRTGAPCALAIGVSGNSQRDHGSRTAIAEGGRRKGR